MFVDVGSEKPSIKGIAIRSASDELNQFLSRGDIPALAAVTRLNDDERAMLPGASVSGWYFWRPEAKYFGVGRIDRDQVSDYAHRKGWDLATTERWLAPSLGYRRS